MVEVTVVGRIRMSISPRRAPRGSIVTATGTVEPVPAAGRVEVRIERQVRGRWRLVRTKTIRLRDGGAYKTSVKLRSRGLHRVWVVSPNATRSGLVRGL
jgi:hypothetical protein